MRSNTKQRRVTVVMSNPHHVLQLVEVRTSVKSYLNEAGHQVYRVDKNLVEKLARDRLTEMHYVENSYDFVGVLVAHDDVLARGRITWAEEVEVKEAVML